MGLATASGIGKPLLDQIAATGSFPLPFLQLDRDGFVLAVSDPRGVFPAQVQPGTDLLGTYEKDPDERARQVASAIRKALPGQPELSWTACPWCPPDRHGPEQGAGCRILISQLQESGRNGVTLVHVPAAPNAPNAQPPLADAELQSQKMEAVGRMAGGVAHDFANLLTLISGYSEILLNRVTELDPLRPELEEIRRAANRGAGMTARLLDFIRSQAVKLQNLDINALVVDLERMLRPIIGEHIELLTSLDAGLGKVKGDMAQMTRVVMNLVLNARDAMPRGGRITIATANVELSQAEALKRELAPGAYVSLRLSDTGSGMDPQTMSHVFEPFFTTKDKGRGTGLGLSTVYGIVKEGHGGVSVASVPGSGTTFTVYLPRSEDARAPQDSHSATRSPGIGTETILLAEDEDGVRRLVKYILSSRGYTVLEARDGVDAVEVYHQYQKPVHLLLTDMMMPRMNGSDLAQVICDLQPNMKVVCMSGYTDEALLRAGALAQGVTFLQKPLKPEVLISKIREVLDAPGRLVSG